MSSRPAAASQGVEPIPDQGVLDVRQTPDHDGAQDLRRPLHRRPQRLHVGRLQIRRNHQPHRPAPRRQTRHPARRQRQPGAGKIPCRPPVQHGIIQARHKEIRNQIVPAGAVGKPQGES